MQKGYNIYGISKYIESYTYAIRSCLDDLEGYGVNFYG